MEVTDKMVEAAIKAHAETPGHITYQDDLYSIRKKKMRAAIEAALFNAPETSAYFTARAT